MNFGIEPTHRQQQRRKQRLRLFIEERIVELQDIFIYACAISLAFGEFLAPHIRNIGVFLWKNRKINVIMTLLLIIVILIALS